MNENEDAVDALRRKLLGGVWIAPMVSSLILPVHAQTSGQTSAGCVVPDATTVVGSWDTQTFDQNGVNVGVGVVTFDTGGSGTFTATMPSDSGTLTWTFNAGTVMFSTTSSVTNNTTDFSVDFINGCKMMAGGFDVGNGIIFTIELNAQ